MALRPGSSRAKGETSHLSFGTDSDTATVRPKDLTAHEISVTLFFATRKEKKRKGERKEGNGGRKEEGGRGRGKRRAFWNLGGEVWGGRKRKYRLCVCVCVCLFVCLFVWLVGLFVCLFVCLCVCVCVFLLVLIEKELGPRRLATSGVQV